MPVLPGPAEVTGLALVPGVVVSGSLEVEFVLSSELEVDPAAVSLLPESPTRGPHADIVVAIPITIAIVGANVSRCAAPQNGQRESRDIT
jgi:hypothetical protein